MTVPWTLQRYIFLELIKTFLLTTIALTVVLALGGGVMNMIKLGEVTPDQLLHLMGLILPVSAALTLPMAALFASAATYGRIAADNEFVACRSGGINIVTLFLPSLLLSLFAAGVTFSVSSFVIPVMIRNLNELIGADLGAIIRQRLTRPRGLTLGGPYRIFADQTRVDASRPDNIVLERVAFLEVDGEEWVRYGTAREVRLDFTREENRIRVAGGFVGASFYDLREGRFGDIGESGIAPYALDTLVSPQIKFLTLGQMLHFRAYPNEWNEVAVRLRKLRTAAGRQAVHEELFADWSRDQTLTFSDARATYNVSAKQAAVVPRGGGLELSDLSIEEHRSGRDRHFTAERGGLEAVRGETLAESGLTLTVYRVREIVGGEVHERDRESLGPVRLDSELVRRLDAVPDEALLDGTASGLNDDAVAKVRAEAVNWRRDVLLRIVSTLHERAAFSVSIPVLVVLGTALAIILRGSHVLAAFGVSFLPALVIMINIVMGKQMAQNAGTHGFGLLIMWSGIAILIAVDFLTLTRWLRR